MNKAGLVDSIVMAVKDYEESQKREAESRNTEIAQDLIMNLSKEGPNAIDDRPSIKFQMSVLDALIFLLEKQVQGEDK